MPSHPPQYAQYPAKGAVIPALPVTIAEGGTGQTTASAALAALGGANVTLSNLQNPVAINQTLQGLDGSAGEPAYGFTSQSGFGMYKGFNNLSFAFENVQALSIDPVGIGAIPALSLPQDLSFLMIGPVLPELASPGPGSLLPFDSTFILASNDYPGSVAVYGFQNSNLGPAFSLRKARGTLTVPAGVQFADILGTLQFGAYDGTSFQSVNGAVLPAAIQALAAENWTSTAHGTDLFFYTTPTGTTATGLALNIDSNKQANFFGSIDCTANIFAAGNIITTATGFNALIEATSASGSGGTFATLVAQTSRGTTSAPTAVQSGDILGIVALRGYNGSIFQPTSGVNLDAQATENWTSTANGTELNIWTTPNTTHQEVNTVTVTSAGSIAINLAGQGLQIKGGSNSRMGTATLVGGTVTVSNTSVDANTKIFLSPATAGGTQGFLSYTQSNGVSFTINSSSPLDTSSVNWLLVESF